MSKVNLHLFTALFHKDFFINPRTNAARCLIFLGASFNKTNGIPHRIPPPSEELSDEGSEIDENDIDMLPDIDHEKDVFRTKVKQH